MRSIKKHCTRKGKDQENARSSDLQLDEVVEGFGFSFVATILASDLKGRVETASASFVDRKGLSGSAPRIEMIYFSNSNCCTSN